MKTKSKLHRKFYLITFQEQQMKSFCIETEEFLHRDGRAAVLSIDSSLQSGGRCNCSVRDLDYRWQTFLTVRVVNVGRS